ncbi:hypothetical protein RB594_009208 [Gaeumannomyces avenae]
MMAPRSSFSGRASSRDPKPKLSASGPPLRGTAANNNIVKPLPEPASTTVIIMVSALLLALGLLATRHVNGVPAPLPEDLQGDAAAAAVSCTSQGIAPILSSFPQAGITLTLERASAVGAGGSFGEGAGNLGAPYPATRLPAVCAVIVRVRNATDQPASDFRFGLLLPTASGAWNGRFLAIGNGGFVGGINWPFMASGPHYGFATMSTDTGHNSAGFDLSWGRGRPADLYEWGYRAMRGSVAAAKHVTQGFYGSSPRRSYFTGCSTGGRQGLKAIQGEPDSFDGALIGAPAWDTKHLMPWATKIGKDNLRSDGSLIFDPTDTSVGGPLDTLRRQVSLQCDGRDGVTDNIVSSPELCTLNYTTFTCRPGQVTACLTGEQVKLVQAFYSDYSLADGSLVHNGMELSSEAELNNWATYLSNPAVANVQYERNFLYNDTTWSLSQYSEDVVRDSRRVNPGQASADSFDLRPFRARGAKVILYHGMGDGLVPTRSTTHYYNRTREVTGGGQGLDDFLRYFLVPGMGHCWFSPAATNAPWMFGGVGQATALAAVAGAPAEFTRPSPPGTPLFRSDPDYDALRLLVAWVEDGAAPEVLKAAAYTAGWRVARTRKLCPYPRKAVLVDAAREDDEAGWVCR